MRHPIALIVRYCPKAKTEKVIVESEEGNEMSNKNQQEKKRFWVRVICIALAVLLGGSSLAAVLATLF